MSVITRQIPLDCKYFDKDVEKHLLEEIKSKLVGTCNKESGYITNVSSIEVLGNNISIISPVAVFTVKIKIETLKPEKKSEYVGVVEDLLPQCIIVKVQNVMSVIIPSDIIKEYKYNETKRQYISGSNVIAKKTKLLVSIRDYKYEQGRLNCIGNLKKIM